ncbi:MAG: NUDIX domain-containing protein [Clostridiales bacterium]|jgi:tRNA nucleotidyltransferase (CCA-adding enzyme)|nr:NUDIX domain-containing protein [Clostridiales bacterium]
MLGKYVRVRVTNPINSHNSAEGFDYSLNFGVVEGAKQFSTKINGAFIIGINHQVRNFDGRVIASIKKSDKVGIYLVVAPKNSRYIVGQIQNSLSSFLNDSEFSIDCLYECSCGAVVYRIINDEYRFLLIKNKRSAHWGFPKGHVEEKETPQDTATREVLEETGIHIDILPDFTSQSEYTIQGKVEKSVTIFLATTKDTQTIIQKEEIEDYVWLSFEKAMETLRFENDKIILNNAHEYLIKQGIIPEGEDD